MLYIEFDGSVMLISISLDLVQTHCSLHCQTIDFWAVHRTVNFLLPAFAAAYCIYWWRDSWLFTWAGGYIPG